MVRGSFLALDVGDARIGVAIANAEVRFSNPLTTLSNDADFLAKLITLIGEHDVLKLIIGLPRNLNGQETEQTKKVRTFAAQLKVKINLPIVLSDEAATSVKAEAELRSRGKPYEKGDIDALAAAYILEDYLSEPGGIEV